MWLDLVAKRRCSIPASDATFYECCNRLVFVLFIIYYKAFICVLSLYKLDFHNLM